MNQILSLASGNSSPLGLSGGATSFAERGPSFSDLLTAHSMQGAAPPPLGASLPGMSAAPQTGSADPAAALRTLLGRQTKPGAATPIDSVSGIAAPSLPVSAAEGEAASLVVLDLSSGVGGGPVDADAVSSVDPSSAANSVLPGDISSGQKSLMPADLSPVGKNLVPGDLPSGDKSILPGAFSSDGKTVLPDELPQPVHDESSAGPARAPTEQALSAKPALPSQVETPVLETTDPSAISQALDVPAVLPDATNVEMGQEAEDGVAEGPSNAENREEPDPELVEQASPDMPSAPVAPPASTIVPAVEGARSFGPTKKSVSGGPDAIEQPDDVRARTSRGGSGDMVDRLQPRSSAEAPPAGPGISDFGKLVQARNDDGAAAGTDSVPDLEGLLSQTRADAVKPHTGTVGAAGSVSATVSARPGEIGQQLGLEIVRQVKDGQDALTIRLDPAEMGEIRIRLQFDDRGTMRAHVAAESSAALEMLRRDSGDLVRALNDAGVRTDAQSFQFDTRGQGRGDQQGAHGRPETPSGQHTARAEPDADDQNPTPRAKLRSSGSLDLFA